MSPPDPAPRIPPPATSGRNHRNPAVRTASATRFT